MTIIESKFIGDFKLGDNINYNLDILDTLYVFFENAEDDEKGHLCKPIILLIASIIEAVLYDLHMRVKLFTAEGVRNLGAAIVDTIKLKKIDDFEKYIASARKHDLFDQADTEFYKRLDDLRRLRNRIHIQNNKKDFARDESAVFTIKRKKMAERALEKTLRTMAAKFARDHDYVKAFTLPWEAHFPA